MANKRDADFTELLDDEISKYNEYAAQYFAVTVWAWEWMCQVEDKSNG